MMRPHGWTPGLFLFLAAGCAEPSVDTAAEWTLGSRTFEVGGVGAEAGYTLTDLAGVTPLANGHVLVADRQPPFLKVFASDGTFLRSLGTKGSGPGEYEFVYDLDWCEPDGISVRDVGGRVHRYSGSLEFTSTELVRFDALVNGTPYAQDCHPNGLRVVTGWGDLSEQFAEGYYRATAPVLLLEGQEIIHDFGSRLSSERIGTVRSDGSPSGSGPHPLGRATVVALGSDRVYVGNGEAYEIEVYDLTGSPLPHLQWEGPSLAFTDDIIVRYADEVAAEADEGDRARARERAMELPSLGQLPAYDRLLVSDVDELWVRQFVRPGDADEVWIVFDSSGERVGRLRLPRGSTLWSVRDTEVVYSVPDDFDVPMVRIEAVER